MFMHCSVTPLFCMANGNDFNPGKPPRDLRQEIAGLEEALRTTEESIKKGNKGPKEVLEAHRLGLIRQLEEARKRVNRGW
jgi:hypothetical protein